MTGLRETLRSSIGAKAAMAVSGVALLLFVLGHMVGNLQLFLGRDTLNGYAAQLQSMGPLLWVARLGLLGVLGVHLAAATHITRKNRAARPVAYQSFSPQVTSFAARTMLVSGFVILGFVVYHLLHLTLGVTNPDHHALVETLADGTERPDVYGMVVAGFSVWPITLVYVAANVLLGLHIAHGASSLVQSLGFTHAACAWCKQCLGPALGAVIVIGNVSMPLSVALGLVK